MLFKLLFSMQTISPFSTSLTNFAPIMSNAQVSEANIYDLFNFPITKGLIPNGSLTPIRVFWVKKTSAYAPWIWKRASIILSIFRSLFDFAISWIIVSVSEVL